jgi:hypothetical protein
VLTESVLTWLVKGACPPMYGSAIYGRKIAPYRYCSEVVRSNAQYCPDFCPHFGCQPGPSAVSRPRLRRSFDHFNTKVYGGHFRSTPFRRFACAKTCTYSHRQGIRVTDGWNSNKSDTLNQDMTSAVVKNHSVATPEMEPSQAFLGPHICDQSLRQVAFERSPSFFYRNSTMNTSVR